jgi:type VI protein secretion system component Hcp
MAVDGFLELVRSGTNTLKGESLDAVYPNWIAIRSFTLTSDLKSAKDTDEEDDEAEDEPEAKGGNNGKTGAGKNSFPEVTGRPGTKPAPKKSTSAPSGGGASAQGKFRLFFKITKDVDAATPDLFQDYCWKAKAEGEGTKVDRFESATVVLRKCAGKPKPYLIIEFKGVSVVSYSVETSEDKLPAETIGFAFKAITLRYRPQEASGKVSRKAEDSAYWSFDEGSGKALAPTSSRV